MKTYHPVSKMKGDLFAMKECAEKPNSSTSTTPPVAPDSSNLPANVRKTPEKAVLSGGGGKMPGYVLVELIEKLRIKVQLSRIHIRKDTHQRFRRE
jgi:hypothetical protein